MKLRAPDVAYAITYRDIESFGSIVEEQAAEPTLFSPGYCARARGEGGLGDCCNSSKKNKGCKKDTGLKCGMQNVSDVDAQRILWAKGEKCVRDDECGEDISAKDGGGTMECFATGVKSAVVAAFSTTIALIQL